MNYDTTIPENVSDYYGETDEPNDDGVDNYFGNGTDDPFERNVTVSEGDNCKVLALPPDPMFANEIEGFSAIVEVLIIDSFIFVMILMIFTVVTKMARKDYYPPQPTGLNWLTLFYGDAHAAFRGCSIDPVVQERLGSPKGYFYWIRAIFCLRDEDYLTRSGLDAVTYLTFQRYIIALSIILTVMSASCIVPVSYFGNLESRTNHYSRTTIANVSSKSLRMWFYPVMGLVTFCIGILVLKFYASTCIILDRRSQSTHTVVIREIDEKDRLEARLESLFLNVFPHVRVEDIQLSYKVSYLMSLNVERLDIESCLKWCNEQSLETGKRPQLIPKCGGLCCSLTCCCCCHEVDAHDFYTHKKVEVLTKMKNEKLRTLQHPLNLAFVTFESVIMLTYVLANVKEIKRQANLKPELSYACNWKLSRSPSAQIILWENLHVSRIAYWIILISLYALYLVFVIFLSTPSVVLTILHLEKSQKSIAASNALIGQYLPSLLLFILSSTFPILVAYSGMLVPYFTKTRYYFSMMIKTFVYLLFMILILPITEFTSVMAFFQMAALKPDQLLRMDCIFLPDNGIFFSLFLIQAGFIGMCIQLIRVPELIRYSLYTLFAKSKAELVSIRKALWYEFEFGFNYAFYLVNFSVIVVFTPAVPLVAPCGLIYLINKHLVDRYNIFFVNSPSEVDKSIHHAPINMAIFAFFLQQLIMMVYSYIRAGYDGVFALYLGGLLVTAIVYLVQVFVPDVAILHHLALPHTRKLMKIKKVVKLDMAHHRGRAWSAYEAQEEEVIALQNYWPDVLKMEYRPEAIRERRPGADLV